MRPSLIKSLVRLVIFIFCILVVYLITSSLFQHSNNVCTIGNYHEERATGVFDKKMSTDLCPDFCYIMSKKVMLVCSKTEPIMSAPTQICLIRIIGHQDTNSFSKEQFCNCLWIDHSAIRLLGYMKIFTQPPCSDHQVHECNSWFQHFSEAHKFDGYLLQSDPLANFLLSRHLLAISRLHMRIFQYLYPHYIHSFQRRKQVDGGAKYSNDIQADGTIDEKDGLPIVSMSAYIYKAIIRHRKLSAVSKLDRVSRATKPKSATIVKKGDLTIKNNNTNGSQTRRLISKRVANNGKKIFANKMNLNANHFHAGSKQAFSRPTDSIKPSNDKKGSNISQTGRPGRTDPMRLNAQVNNNVNTRHPYVNNKTMTLLPAVPSRRHQFHRNMKDETNSVADANIKHSKELEHELGQVQHRTAESHHNQNLMKGLEFSNVKHSKPSTDKQTVTEFPDGFIGKNNRKMDIDKISNGTEAHQSFENDLSGLQFHSITDKNNVQKEHSRNKAGLIFEENFSALRNNEADGSNIKPSNFHTINLNLTDDEYRTNDKAPVNFMNTKNLSELSTNNWQNAMENKVQNENDMTEIFPNQTDIFQNFNFDKNKMFHDYTDASSADYSLHNFYDNDGLNVFNSSNKVDIAGKNMQQSSSEGNKQEKMSYLGHYLKNVNEKSLQHLEKSVLLAIIIQNLREQEQEIKELEHGDKDANHSRVNDGRHFSLDSVNNLFNPNVAEIYTDSDLLQVLIHAIRNQENRIKDLIEANRVNRRIGIVKDIILSREIPKFASNLLTKIVEQEKKLNVLESTHLLNGIYPQSASKFHTAMDHTNAVVKNPDNNLKLVSNINSEDDSEDDDHDDEEDDEADDDEEIDDNEDDRNENNKKSRNDHVNSMYENGLINNLVSGYDDMDVREIVNNVKDFADGYDDDSSRPLIGQSGDETQSGFYRVPHNYLREDISKPYWKRSTKARNRRTSVSSVKSSTKNIALFHNKTQLHLPSDNVMESNTVTTKRNMLIAAVRQRKEGTGGDGSSSGSGEANTYIHDGMAVQEQPSPASGNSAIQTSHSLPLESTPSSSMQSDGETQKPDAAKKYSYLDTHQLMMVVVALGTVLTTVLIVCLLCCCCRRKKGNRQLSWWERICGSKKEDAEKLISQEGSVTWQRNVEPTDVMEPQYNLQPKPIECDSDGHSDFMKRLTTQRLSIYQEPVLDEDELSDLTAESKGMLETLASTSLSSNTTPQLPDDEINTSSQADSLNVDSRQIDDGDIKKEIFSQNKVPGEKINEKCSDVQFDYDKDISVKDKLSKTGKNKIAAKKESRKKKVVIADQKEDNRGNKKHTFEGNTNVDENTEKKKKGEIKTDNISSHSKKLKNKSKDEKKSSKKQDYIKDGEVKSKNKGKKVVGKKKKNKVKSFDASDSDNKSLENSSSQMSEKPNISTSKTKNKSKLSKLKKKGKNKQVERRSGSKELLKTGGQDCKGRSKEDMSGNSNFTYCRRYGGWYGDRELCDFQQKAVKCLLPHHRSQPTSGRADSASTSSTDFATDTAFQLKLPYSKWTNKDFERARKAAEQATADVEKCPALGRKQKHVSPSTPLTVSTVPAGNVPAANPQQSVSQPAARPGSIQVSVSAAAGTLATLASTSSTPLLSKVSKPPPVPKESHIPTPRQLARRRMTIKTKFGEVGTDFG